MAVLAVIYGIASGHGMWYPINLLSGGFFPARSTIEQIAIFSLGRSDHCNDYSPSLFGARRPSLWRRASDVSAPPILLEGESHLSYGLVCCIACSKPLILCSTSGLTGFGFVISQIGFGV